MTHCSHRPDRCFTSPEQNAAKAPSGAVPSEPAPAAEAELPVRIREILRGDGEQSAWAGVPCPRTATTKTFDECAECARFRGVHFDSHGAAAVRCEPGVAAPVTEEAAGHAAEAGVIDAASSTLVGAVAAHRFACVTEDASAESVMTALLAPGASGVPVVDAAGKPVGVVTRTDFLRRTLEEGDTYETALPDKERRRLLRDAGLGNDMAIHEVVPRVVGDVMTPLALSLPETATVAQAAAVMAYEGIHQVPIVSRTGEVVALVTSLDVLRWLARRAGYLVFEPARQPLGT